MLGNMSVTIHHSGPGFWSPYRITGHMKNGAVFFKNYVASDLASNGQPVEKTIPEFGAAHDYNVDWFRYLVFVFIEIFIQYC